MRLLLAAFFAVALCGIVSPAQAQEPLKVGIILPLTGRAASAGNGIKNGIELARQGLSSSDSRLIEIKYEDDSSDSKSTLAAYQKLSAEGASVIFSAFSNAGNMIAPIAERDRITHISFAFDPNISKDTRYSFTLYARLSDLATAAVAEARKRGYRKIAAVVTTHEGNIAMLKALKAAAEGKLSIVSEQEVLPTESDFGPVAARLAASKDLDAVANLLHPGQMGVFAKRARSSGLGLPQFALANFEDAAVVQSAAGALDGQWYGAADYSGEFLTSYRKTYPSATIVGAAYGHDALKLLVDGLKSRKPLPDYLASVDRFSGASKHLSSDGSHGFKIAVKIKVVGQDGIYASELENLSAGRKKVVLFEPEVVSRND